jgi:hypothetical protein
MMMPIAAPYSAVSPCDVRVVSKGERGCGRAVYSVSKLQSAKVVKAAMRGTTVVKGRGVIRPSRVQSLFAEFDGALHFRVGRRGSGEPETAALAVLIEILSATGPRYNLV